MDTGYATAIEAVLEQLIERGRGGIATVFTRTFEIAALQLAGSPPGRPIIVIGDSRFAVHEQAHAIV